MALTARRTRTSRSPASKRTSDRKAWIVAWVLTLALHLGAFFGLRGFPQLNPAPVQAHEPAPIQLVFSRPGSETRKTEEPHFFSELPPDRADAAPKKADFLSNVTSRARDRVPGGDASLPRMQGEGEAPTALLEPDDAASRPPAAPPQAKPTTTTPSTESSSRTGARVQNQGGRSATPPNPRDADSPPTASHTILRDVPGSLGNSDFHQPEMSNPDGNAGLTGDVSLNTTAWEYAPWLERFSRQLMHRWMAPPAYYFGILKEGGWAVIEIEVSRSGEVLRLDLLEEQGHPSLIRAAEGALRSMSPMEHLPADFPEPTLVLRIRMIYPRIRSR
jgi:hypothetical protein